MPKKNKGFTLVELMIVVAIVGIIAAISYPSYTRHVQKTRRADGKIKLLEVMAKQERHYSLNNTYVIGLAGLGYDEDVVDSNKNYYLVTAAECGSGIGSCVKLTAASQGVQASDTECTSLTVDSLGNKDATGTLGSDCW